MIRFLPTAPWLFVLVLTVALVTGGNRTLAQNSLPDDLVQAAQLSGPQLATMKKYVDDRAPGLTKPDKSDVVRARKSLCSPLQNLRASVDFRLQYTEVVMPHLQAAAKAKDAHSVVNALVVAQSLGTDIATKLLEDYIADQRDPVRYAAVNGLGRSLDVLSRGNPALTQERALQVITLLRNSVQNEANIEIVGIAARGLEFGLLVPTAQPLPRVRGESALALAGSTADRLAKPATNEELLKLDAIYIRVGDSLRGALTGGAAIPGPAKEQAVRLGKDLAKHVLARLDKFPLPADPTQTDKVKADRQPIAQLANVCEALVIFGTDNPNKESKDPGSNILKMTPAGDQAARSALEEISKR